MRKSTFSHAIVSERFTRLFASVIIVVGLIVLIGWYSKLMFLTRFSINEVPMAPSTAYVLVCLAVGLWFYIHSQKLAINRNATIAFAVIVICLSCLLVITNIFKYYAHWEHAFTKIPETQLSMQLGHMSLVTALLFIISGFALLFLLSNRKIVRTFSIILTLIIFIFSLTLLLGYGFGTPLFYFNNFIPPAVLTVLSFLLVSLALIAASDKNTFFVKTIWKTSTSAKLLRIFLPTTIAIIVIESLIIIRILPLFNINTAIGVSLVSLIVVAAVVVIISILSKSMGKSLDTALENLSESEEKFRIVFENSPVGKSMTGIDGSLHVNQSFCKLVGYTEEELRAKTWMDISHPDEIQKNEEIIQSLLNGKISQAQFEKRYIHKNGTTVFADVSTYLQRNTDGDPEFFITSVFDITERKQAELALRETNIRHAAMIENISDIIAIIGADGITIYQSPNIEKWFGWKPENLIGANGFDMIHPDDIERIQEEFNIMLKRGTASLVEYRFKCKDGNYKWIELTAINRINDPAIGGVLLNYHDITERKLAEEKEKTHHSNIDLLSKTAMQFVEFPKDSNIYDFVGERVREFVGKDSYIVVNSVDRKTGFSTIESVLGVGKFAKIITNKLGRHPVGMKLEVEDPNVHHQDGRLHVYQEGLYALLFNTIPKSICKSIEKLAGAKKIYVIDLVNKDQFFGNIIIFLKEETAELKNKQLIETFIQQASIAILKRQAEKALRESDERVRNLLMNMEAGIVVHAPDTSIVQSNAMASELLGLSEDQMNGKTVVDPAWKFINPDKTPLPLTDYPVNRVADSGMPIKNQVFGISHPGKNSITWLTVNGFPMMNNKGNIIEIVISFIDITEQKLAEELLRESEAKLTALFTSLTELVVMHELVLNDAGEAINYRIIDCNKAFAEFTGISKENAIGKLVTEVYKTDAPPYLEEYSKVGLSGVPHEFNTYYKPLDKHLMISVVSPQHGKFATITTDITPMMQIQNIIIAKNKEMENYLYIASHDLRTPLVNIQGFSQRFKKQTDSLKTLFADKTLEPEILHQLANITDENIPKTLNFIISNIEKMDSLINGLLQLSRTGRVEMNIQKVDMNELFAKILHSLDFQIKETACKTYVNPLPECYGDAALLDQLFTNIINNALNYYDTGRPLEITVDAKSIFNKVVYSIKDTGKGIAPKHLDKIWDVFYRVDPKSGKAGEGIGLSLVKRIVEKHKGKIWVESEKNKGSVFHIELHNRKFTEI